jgi:hypothetical protein
MMGNPSYEERTAAILMLDRVALQEGLKRYRDQHRLSDEQFCAKDNIPPAAYKEVMSNPHSLIGPVAEVLQAFDPESPQAALDIIGVQLPGPEIEVAPKTQARANEVDPGQGLAEPKGKKTRKSR